MPAFQVLIDIENQIESFLKERLQREMELSKQENLGDRMISQLETMLTDVSVSFASQIIRQEMKFGRT